MQINESTPHASGVSQVQHLHWRRSVCAYFRDHIVGACVTSEVDQNIDAFFLNALRNCKLATTVKQPCHVQKPLDRLYNLATPLAVVVLIQRKGGSEYASAVVQSIHLIQLYDNKVGG